MTGETVQQEKRSVISWPPSISNSIVFDSIRWKVSLVHLVSVSVQGEKPREK